MTRHPERKNGIIELFGVTPREIYGGVTPDNYELWAKRKLTGEVTIEKRLPRGSESANEPDVISFHVDREPKAIKRPVFIPTYALLRPMPIQDIVIRFNPKFNEGVLSGFKKLLSEAQKAGWDDEKLAELEQVALRVRYSNRNTPKKGWLDAQTIQVQVDDNVVEVKKSMFKISIEVRKPNVIRPEGGKPVVQVLDSNGDFSSYSFGDSSISSMPLSQVEAKQQPEHFKEVLRKALPSVLEQAHAHKRWSSDDIAEILFTCGRFDQETRFHGEPIVQADPGQIIPLPIDR